MKTKSKEHTDRKYFSQIPHVIDDLPLKAASVRVYLHIKRRTGEKQTGKCWETSANIAKHLRMSASTVCRAKAELVQFGLIKIEKKLRGHGEFPSDEITVNDIWEFNRDYYDKGS